MVEAHSRWEGSTPKRKLSEAWCLHYARFETATIRITSQEPLRTDSVAAGLLKCGAIVKRAPMRVESVWWRNLMECSLPFNAAIYFYYFNLRLLCSFI